MAVSDPGLRRVAVHADGASVDLTLPAAVPVAELIPSIVDTLGGPMPGTRYHLGRLGASPLPNSTTLMQNGIRDGTALVLSRETPTPPAVRYDDEAEAVSATLGSRAASGQGRGIAAALATVCFTAVSGLALVRYAYGAAQRSDISAAVAATGAIAALTMAVAILRIRRDPVVGLTLSLIATTFAGVAGLLVVPGIPSAPNVLLAAMAAAVTAVLAIRVTHCGAVILAATACCAAITAVAALASVITGAPPHVVGSATALSCLGLIEVAPRVSIQLAGLAPSIDHDDLRTESELTASTLRAHGWLTSLQAGLAAAAAVGAATAAVSAHRAIALAAVTGGLLVLHTRAGRAPASMFAATGIATITTAFIIGAVSLPRQAPWIAALAAAAAAAAIYLGFVGPVDRLSPVARRGGHALECIALAVVTPLTCWTCGAFGAVRGLNLLHT